MSVVSTDLYCDKCNFHGSNAVMWGEFRYVEGGTEFWVKRTLGWCANCSQFTPIEDFGDRENVADQIAEIVDDLRVRARKWISFSFSKNRRKLIEEKLNKLPRLIKRAGQIERRMGSERCLICGSLKVTRFDGDCSQVDPFKPGKDAVRTGYIHPACGGEILAKTGPNWLHLVFNPKYYTLDGRRIKSA